VRLADFVCVLSILLAVVVAEWGGFRMRIGDQRVALTSPYRLLIWAVALGVVRHLLYRQAPVYRDVPERFLAWWKTPPVRTAVSVFLGTRPAILFVGYLAIFMIGYRDAGVPFRIVENEFGNLQARWDTGWYLGIATDGYHYSPNPLAQQNIVFFPAYPISMRIVGRLLGGESPAFVWGGTLISLGAFLGALIYMYRLARDLLNSETCARDAVWLLAAYPFAVFFGAAYSESLFLLGVVGAFYHFRKREFARAALWGLLVGLSRPNGSFLAIPLALLAFAPWLPWWLTSSRAVVADHDQQQLRSAGRLLQALAAAAMPVAGLTLYSAYIWSLTGNPLAWVQTQAAWERHYVGYGELVMQRYDWLSHGLYAYIAQNPGDLLNLSGALFVIGASVPVARRLGLPYAIFILINILPPIASGFLSAGRFSSVLFPAFIWLAGAIPARHRPGWFASFMALQALVSVLFYTWRPMY